MWNPSAKKHTEANIPSNCKSKNRHFIIAIPTPSSRHTLTPAEEYNRSFVKKTNREVKNKKILQTKAKLSSILIHIRQDFLTTRVKYSKITKSDVAIVPIVAAKNSIRKVSLDEIRDNVRAIPLSTWKTKFIYFWMQHSVTIFLTISASLIIPWYDFRYGTPRVGL